MPQRIKISGTKALFSIVAKFIGKNVICDPEDSTLATAREVTDADMAILRREGVAFQTYTLSS